MVILYGAPEKYAIVFRTRDEALELINRYDLDGREKEIVDCVIRRFENYDSINIAFGKVDGYCDESWYREHCYQIFYYDELFSDGLIFDFDTDAIDSLNFEDLL